MSAARLPSSFGSSTSPGLHVLEQFPESSPPSTPIQAARPVRAM